MHPFTKQRLKAKQINRNTLANFLPDVSAILFLLSLLFVNNKRFIHQCPKQLSFDFIKLFT
jgi:hypothetical protein